MSDRGNHWLPSAYLARFSTDQHGRSRGRTLYTLDRGQDEPRRTAAGRVAVETNRYILDLQPDRWQIDRDWDYYETRLSQALDTLTELRCAPTSSFDAMTWLTVLVPFAAAAFVRSPDFDRRYSRRIGSPSAAGEYRLALYENQLDDWFTNDEPTPPPLASPTRDELNDNLNTSRLAEWQRLLVPVLTANWTILHSAPSAEPYILSDMGYLTGGPKAIPLCMATIPLGPHHALGLGFRWTKEVCYGSAGRWKTRINHLDVPNDFVAMINREVARTAESTVIAGAPDILAAVKSALAEQPNLTEDSLWLTALTRDALCAMEREWQRLLSVLVKYRPGDPNIAQFSQDLSAIRRYFSWAVLTYNRAAVPHVALSSNDRHTRIYSSMPSEIIEDDLGIRAHFPQESDVPIVPESMTTEEMMQKRREMPGPPRWRIR